MKKFLSILLALTFVLCAFAGCNSGKEADTTVADTQRTVTSEMIAAKKIFFIMLKFRVLLICFHSIMSQ